MALSLHSGTIGGIRGILLLLFTLTLEHSSAANDTCATFYAHITSVEEVSNVGASFLQRVARAMSQAEDETDRSKAAKQLHSAGMLSNRTVNEMLDLKVPDFQNWRPLSNASFHVSLIDALGAPSWQLPSAEQAVLADGDDGAGADDSHVDDIAAGWLIPAVIFACLLIGVYFCFETESKASDVLSDPTANQQSTPVEIAPNVQSSSSGARRNPRDVIEELGFGLAQLRVVLLADGICFIDGWELGLVSTVATATASDMGLGDYGRALLASTVAAGLIPGCILGGWLGDRIGRRPPIITSYFIMAFCAWGTSVAPDVRVLLAFRVLMGFACGLGVPTSTVMISELTPARWRTAAIGLRSFLWTTGVVLSHIICCVLDPTLEQLNWRLCFRMTLPPLLLFLIPTCLLLDESPMFLACVGDHAKAEIGFQHMRHLNSCPEVSISYTDGSPSDDSNKDKKCTGSFWDHLRVMFGPGMLGCTMTLMILSVSAGLYGSGHGYGLPRVLIVEAEKHRLTPGMQLLIDCSWGYVACLMLFALDRYLTRKRMLLFFQAALTVCFTTLAWSAHSDKQIWLVMTLLQVSLATVRMVLKMDHMMIGLASTECYPTALLSTGAAVVIGIGRLGSIAGPIVFEFLHTTLGVVTAFYYTCSVLALLNAFAILWLLPRDLDTARTSSTEQLATMLTESAACQACDG